MRIELLDVLACPACGAALECRGDQDSHGNVHEGTLNCTGCGRAYPITRGIPRFVPEENYAASFGFQWNRFKEEQIDSRNRTRLSEQRVFSETGWSPQWLKGKWILDAGSGAGRFLDALSGHECNAVGVDISNAVDAAQATLHDRPNVHLVQASLFNLPFRSGSFDGVYCIGVIQHTPDPERAVRALPRILRRGGRIAVTAYERRTFTKLSGKYLLRPFVRRLPPRALLSLIRAAMPVAFPVTDLLFRVPVLGRLFRFAIPIANYVDNTDLTYRQRYRWAVLDTFDMLSPAYDAPQVEGAVRRYLTEEGIVELERQSNPGLNLVGVLSERPVSVRVPSA